MSGLDKRKDVFEAKFKNDEETKFKVRVKSVKSLGLWAADKLGLEGSESESYAKKLVDIDFKSPSFVEVVAEIEEDFKEKEIKISNHQIETQLKDGEEEIIKALLEE